MNTTSQPSIHITLSGSGGSVRIPVGFEQTRLSSSFGSDSLIHQTSHGCVPPTPDSVDAWRSCADAGGLVCRLP